MVKDPNSEYLRNSESQLGNSRSGGSSDEQMKNTGLEDKFNGSDAGGDEYVRSDEGDGINSMAGNSPSMSLV